METFDLLAKKKKILTECLVLSSRSIKYRVTNRRTLPCQLGHLKAMFGQ